MKWISRHALATMGAAGIEVMVVAVVASDSTPSPGIPPAVTWFVTLSLAYLVALSWIGGVADDSLEGADISTNVDLILISPIVVPMAYLLYDGAHVVLGYLFTIPASIHTLLVYFSAAPVLVQEGVIFGVGGILLGFMGGVYYKKKGC